MSENEGLLSFGGHLEVLRQMLFRVIGVTFVFSCIIFCFKDQTFEFLLAPSESSFVTYRWIEDILRHFNSGFCFDTFRIDLIATDLSSQFMTHITTSLYLGMLCASPYIMYEIFRFVSPALMDDEKAYSSRVVCWMYLLFAIGVLLTYFVIFPFSVRFLGTYNVAERVRTTITLDSYISTFSSMTFLMGIVFQLPVVTYVLTRMGLINAADMARYRKHALILIMLVAAVITPPDILTLILVALPLYLLYEFSIHIIPSKSVRE